jgi:hypothetical protein
MMGHADADMQFTYTVGVDENKRQGRRASWKRISQISGKRESDGELTMNPELLRNQRVREMGPTGLEPMTSCA